MNRVTFLSLAYHPDTSASSQLFIDLFARLVERGVPMRVLCGFSAKDADTAEARVARREWHRGVEVVRCGLKMPGKRSLGARVLSYSSFLAHAALHLAVRDSADLTVGSTDPPFTPILLWLLARILRFRFQLVLLDLYPDGLVALGSMNRRALVTRLWYRLNARSYRAADRIIVIGRDMAELLERRYGVDPCSVTWIPSWCPAELEISRDGDGSQFPAGMRPAGKFVVQYSGNMGLWHDMDAFVRVAGLLQDEGRVQFLFLGRGCRRDRAEQLAHHLGVDNITWCDFVPREQLGSSLAACSLALISLRAGLEGVAVPSKLYGILAAGRAVIAQVPETSEVARVVKEEACGIVVPPGDIHALAKAIRELARDPDVAIRMGRRARRAYEAAYTLDRAVAAYAAVWGEPASARGRNLPGAGVEAPGVDPPASTAEALRPVGENL